MLPNLQNVPRSRDIIPAFNGINRTNEITDTEMSAMKNVSFREYPYLRTRRCRGTVSTGHTDIYGIYGADKLYIVGNGKLTVTDNLTTTYNYAFSDSKKQFARMGNRLCIFPDKVVFDGTEIKPMGNTSTANSVTFTLADAEGNVITYHDDAYWSTHTPADGDYKMTKVEGVSELQRYSGTSASWYVVVTSCVQISATNIGKGYNKGDGVKIDLDLSSTSYDDIKSILTETDGNSHYFATYPILDVTDNAITIYGLLTQNKTVSATISVSREVPDIKYVCEAGNRLWGCNEEGTEIYASKLGDPFNWNCYEGISTDSWAVTIGSQGKFTGACSYLGMPTFFKEESLTKISISATGAHVTKDVSCRGVQEGCADSLCIVNELLFYKAKNAFVAYDGSLPQSISKRLGDVTNIPVVVCGKDDENLYCLCIYDEGQNLLVYDTTRGIWSSEECEGINCLTAYKNVLYGAKTDELETLGECSDSVGEMEGEKISFSLETKNFDYTSPDMKYLSKMMFSCHMEAAAEMDILIAYNRSNKYERICHIDSFGERIIPVIMQIKRCNSFRIKVTGKGDVTFYSITKYIAEGSDKP